MNFMISYQDLRTKLGSLEKIPGCVNLERPPLINDGFPGHFNYSFTEYPWLKEYGRYMSFDHDFIFSCIPTCIRYDDVFNEKTKKSNLDSTDSWKYLGVFEMSDLAGIASYKGIRDIYELQYKQAAYLIGLLVNFGISMDKIFCSYQRKGSVQDITKDKFTFNATIDEDEIGKQVFLDLGVPISNVQPDSEGAALLSLNLFQRRENGGQWRVPSPWGYRNEININLGTKDRPKWLDIATLERFAYRPIVENEKIIGLDHITDSVSIGAVGLERLCLLANGLDSIQKIDHLEPFYKELKITQSKVRVGECLRALHFIYTDVRKENIDLSKYQRTRDRIRIGFLQTIARANFKINEIRKLLDVHARYQPWHPELKEGIDSTIEAISIFLNRKNRN